MLRFFEAHMSEFMADLETLVNMDSPSRNKALTDAALDYVVRRARELMNVSVERKNHESLGDTIAIRIGQTAASAVQTTEQVLVLGHVDTVWPEGETTRRPFRLDGDCAYGPGVFDMKCGLIQGLYALAGLQQQLTDRPYAVCFLVNADEEITSPSSRKFIEEEAKKSKAVFVLEPAIGSQGALKTARKGVGRFEVKVTGVPAHSGIDPQNGASAIEEMARQIVFIHSLTDHGQGSTLNVGKLQGGTAVNVVAGEATAEVDLRVETMEEADRLTQILQQLRPLTKRTSVSVTGGMIRPPMSQKVTRRLYSQAEKIADSLGFSLSEEKTGGASDGCFTAALGIETLDGLGAVGAGAHAYDEFVRVADIPRRGALLAELIMAQF